MPPGSRRALRIARLSFALAAPIGWYFIYLLFRNTPGQDWMVFDTAAKAWRAGDARLLLDGVGFTQALNASHAAWLTQSLAFHPWVYPPITLLLALPFGWLPFGVSYVAWVSLTMAAMIAALWLWEKGARRYWLIGGVLLCPATAYAIGAGQNSFFIAAIVVAGLWWLPRKPARAGLLLCLLAFKPQFALMVPVMFVAGRHWRAMAFSVAGGLALVALSVAATGTALWQGWLHLILGHDPSFRVWIEAGRLYGQSVYTCLRIAGASHRIANFGQLAAMLLSAICVWTAFRKPGPSARSLIVVLCAMMLAAPHVSPYDAVLLAIAAMMTLLAGTRREFLPGEAPLAMLVWLSTLINPPALIGLGVITPVLVAALMIRETLERSGAQPSRGPARTGWNEAIPPGPPSILLTDGGSGGDGSSPPVFL